MRKQIQWHPQFRSMPIGHAVAIQVSGKPVLRKLTTPADWPRPDIDNDVDLRGNKGSNDIVQASPLVTDRVDGDRLGHVRSSQGVSRPDPAPSYTALVG